jgi:hypothetical protein
MVGRVDVFGMTGADSSHTPNVDEILVLFAQRAQLRDTQTKGRSRLAEMYCAATAMVNADTSSRAETKGRSHRQIDARDPGRGGRSYTADHCFVLPAGPPLPGEVPEAA